MSVPARVQAPPAPALLEIQAPIRERLDQVAPEMWRIVRADAPIVEAVNAHLMGMKGKMFRPTLLLLASALEGAPEERAVPLAAAGELVHLASVVHDDSVDHSALRRGMPTINALFSHQVAVIGGDFLYSRALAELVRLGDLEPLRVLTAASNEMTLGELRQLATYDALEFTEQDYWTLIRCKTASLLGAMCEIGALAGAPRWRAAMARYGERLGMAFQVADDLLDYTADASQLGKPSGNDLREHKVTLPLICALPKLSRVERARVEALFADPTPGDAHIADVVAIVDGCGGLEAARLKGAEFAEEAEAALTGIPASSARDALTDAIAYVIERRF
ncbi:MAG: polyprenyl synthetase family protein [Gemmatimonadaceae bacterium]|nr:polyprenyl synthetase family protein [Gemmatimonadaceae bacterium]